MFQQNKKRVGVTKIGKLSYSQIQTIPQTILYQTMKPTFAATPLTFVKAERFIDSTQILVLYKPSAVVFLPGSQVIHMICQEFSHATFMFLHC